MPEPRPDPYVLARFLEALWSPAGQPAVVRSKSSLQRACRVNYDLFRRYLAFCIERDFVKVTEGQGADQVCLTPEGREAHRRLVGWIRDLLGEGMI